MILESLSVPYYEEEPLFEHFLPYGHQVIAREIFRTQKDFFLFLTAPTGAGKTDAWAVPALIGELTGVTIALYPTNALAEDQFRTLSALRDHIAPDTPIEFITSERLIEMRESEAVGQTKGEIISGILRRMASGGSGIIISNPDIFVYALRDIYVYSYLLGCFRSFISTVVFDEFHLYDLRQSDTILFMLDELRWSGSAINRFIFLSATPSDSMVQKIKGVIGGNLTIAGPVCQAQEVGHRVILPEVEIQFVPVGKFSSGERFIRDIGDFLAFKKEFRVAVILDSAIEVAVVSQYLREHTSLKICEQSGLCKNPMDEPFDVLIGNKAVEVGIDFKGPYSIQRLIFSAYSVSEFLQRLGRIRNPDPSVVYKAICYAPEEVCNHLSSIKKISRDDLRIELAKTMKDPRVFENFRWRWGYLSAWEYLNIRAFGYSARDVLISNHPNQLPQTGGLTSDRRDEYLLHGLNRLYDYFFDDECTPHPEPPALMRLLQKISNIDRKVLAIMSELSHFRGSGLSLLMYFKPTGEVRQYDLFFLLRWAEMELLEKNEFTRRIPQKKRKRAMELIKGVTGCAVVSGLREKPRKVWLEGPVIEQMRVPEEQRIPGLVYGLHPQVVDPSAGCSLNLYPVIKSVEQTSIFCLYLSLPPYQCRKYYELGDYAALLPYKGGSLALGYDALLADCAVALNNGTGDRIPFL